MPCLITSRYWDPLLLILSAIAIELVCSIVWFVWWLLGNIVWFVAVEKVDCTPIIEKSHSTWIEEWFVYTSVDPLGQCRNTPWVGTPFRWILFALVASQASSLLASRFLWCLSVVSQCLLGFLSSLAGLSRFSHILSPYRSQMPSPFLPQTRHDMWLVLQRLRLATSRASMQSFGWFSLKIELW